jgi:hypothetical protein
MFCKTIFLWAGINIHGSVLDEELRPMTFVKQTKNGGVSTAHAATQVAKSNQLMGAPMLSAHPVPFVKKSPVWSLVEMMDVFKELPQQPHFLPLRECSVDMREEIALGLMVAFAKLVHNKAFAKLVHNKAFAKLVHNTMEASIEESKDFF